MSVVYLVWATVAIGIVFVKDGLNNANITHLIVLAILAGSLLVFRQLKPKKPKLFFICSGVILASLVEGAYMITDPVLPSLLVEISNFDWSVFLRNYAIDLVLTVPVYVAIFFALWLLITKYEFKTWEYIFFVAVGQALGDGGDFFITNPGMLLFLPYVMLNYHAMNVAPFLSVEKLIPGERSTSAMKYVWAVGGLMVIYTAGGLLIHVVASMANL